MPHAIRVYISGPMFGIPDHNFPAFEAAEQKLRALGFEPLNPAKNPTSDNAPWEECLRVDLIQLLEQADVIYFLPGAENSRGARLEAYVAERLNIPEITFPVKEQ